MDGWQVNSQKSLDNAMKLYYNSNNINGINMIRIGFGKNKGVWFARIDYWFGGIRL